MHALLWSLGAFWPSKPRTACEWAVLSLLLFFLLGVFIRLAPSVLLCRCGACTSSFPTGLPWRDGLASFAERGAHLISISYRN